MYIWLGLIILFSIVEAITPAIVSVWFALGSLFALGAAAIGSPEWLQITIFIFISALSLILTRPLVKRRLLKNFTPTNSDMLIGKCGVVINTINNSAESGSVRIQGKIWTARSEDDSEIPENTRVIVTNIEGVKLIVKLSQ